MDAGIAGLLRHSHLPNSQRNPGCLNSHALLHEGNLEQRRFNRPAPAQ